MGAELELRCTIRTPPLEAGAGAFLCTVTVCVWCFTIGLCSRVAFATEVPPSVSEIAATPTSSASASPAAIVIADRLVMGVLLLDGYASHARGMPSSGRPDGG